MSRTQLTAALAVAPTTVDGWRRGGCPTEGIGRDTKYRLADVVSWLRARDREQAAPPLAAVDLAHERARLTKARADLAEAELERTLETLVPSEIVVEIIGVVFHNIRGKLLAFPGRYGARIANKKAPAAKALLRAAVLEVLGELSSGEEILKDTRTASRASR